MKLDISWTCGGGIHIGDPDDHHVPYVTIEFHDKAKNLSQLTKLQLLHRGLDILLKSLAKESGSEPENSRETREATGYNPRPAADRKPKPPPAPPPPPTPPPGLHFIRDSEPAPPTRAGRFAEHDERRDMTADGIPDDEDWREPDCGFVEAITAESQPPEPSTRTPPVAMIEEWDTRPKCPKCGSTQVRRWMRFGRPKGCIQPECRNYYQRTDTRLEEGKVRKGGIGSRPEGPPPPSPKGQKP